MGKEREKREGREMSGCSRIQREKIKVRRGKNEGGGEMA